MTLRQHRLIGSSCDRSTVVRLFDQDRHSSFSAGAAVLLRCLRRAGRYRHNLARARWRDGIWAICVVQAATSPTSRQRRVGSLPGRFWFPAAASRREPAVDPDRMSIAASIAGFRKMGEILNRSAFSGEGAIIFAPSIAIRRQSEEKKEMDAAGFRLIDRKEARSFKPGHDGAHHRCEDRWKSRSSCADKRCGPGYQEDRRLHRHRFRWRNPEKEEQDRSDTIVRQRYNGSASQQLALYRRGRMGRFRDDGPVLDSPVHSLTLHLSSAR